MKNILIYAYTEFNLGDDLFIKVLCDRYPDTEFSLLAPGKYKISFKGLKNLRVHASDSILIRGINFLFKKIKRSDFVHKFLVNRSDGIVHIGGSIFMQGEYWKEYFHKAETIRNKSKPYFLLGANFGPYSDDEYYQTHKELFQQYSDICFREEYSYQLFKDLRNVRLAPDIIFQLAPPESHVKENYVAISVIKPSSKGLGGYDLLYYEKMKDVAMHCIQQGFEVHFLSFCEHEGDHEAIDQIISLLPKELVPQTKIHLYTTNIEEILTVLAQSSFVVASRFHAMILGWVYHKPVFPIAYSNKMINVMQDAGFTGEYTDFAGLESLQPEQVFNSMSTNELNISTQVIQAEGHFEMLDSYLSLQSRRAYESKTEYS